MVTLNVAAGGCWRTEDGWPWIRIKDQSREDSKGRLLLEKCLLCDCDDDQDIWKKEFHVELLQSQKSGDISFEIWTGEYRSTDLLQFATGWSVDLERWIQSGATKRWYKIKKARVRGKARVKPGMEGCEYRESAIELQSSAAYVCVSIAGVEEPIVESSDLPQSYATVSTNEAPPARKSNFQFVLPHRSLARSGKLRSVRVGQIVHELRTDILHDLLPLTLYGHTSAGRCSRPSLNRSKEPNDGMTKALGLLQLSCQYASYCVNELDLYSSKIERRSAKYMGKVNRLQHRQNLLKEQKTNLKREAEVLSCSLDGMQSLLQELDPGTLAQLQGKNNHNLATC